MLELVTYRITGHSRRDTSMYQPDEEKEAALKNEPIGRFSRHLLSESIAPEKKLNEIDKSVDNEIEEAVEAAIADPEPEPEDLYKDLFVE